MGGNKDNGTYGFDTYETWLAYQWLFKRHADHEFWEEQVLQCLTKHMDDRDLVLSRLTKLIVEAIAQLQPIIDRGLYADLLTAGLQKINSRQLAEHLLEKNMAATDQ